MKHRVAIMLGLILAIPLGFSLAIAQEPSEPPPPPPPDMFFIAGQGVGPGEPIEVLGFEGMHPGKQVTGAPFSATGVSQTTQSLSDGNQITRKTQTLLFRDSQ